MLIYAHKLKIKSYNCLNIRTWFPGWQSVRIYVIQPDNGANFTTQQKRTVVTELAVHLILERYITQIYNTTTTLKTHLSYHQCFHYCTLFQYPLPILTSQAKFPAQLFITSTEMLQQYKHIHMACTSQKIIRFYIPYFQRAYFTGSMNFLWSDYGANQWKCTSDFILWFVFHTIKEKVQTK